MLDGFSGHADRGDLGWWYEQTGGHIEQAFLVHGEPESMDALAPAPPALRPDPRPDTRAQRQLRGLNPVLRELELERLHARFVPCGQVIDAFPVIIVRSFIQFGASGRLGRGTV